MRMIDRLAVELQQDCASTKKYLERLPEEYFDWKPHDKSWTLGQLASHLVDIMGGVAPTFKKDEYIFDPQQYQPYYGLTRRELIDTLDKNLAEALDAIRKSDDDQLHVIWRMTSDGKTIMEMPRIDAFRELIMHHMAHHRGQLGVYLRLKGVALPKLYGPTADNSDLFS